MYEIDERKKEPVGGASRLATAIKERVNQAIQETGERPIIVFSGDCLNPSTLSCATQGKHMVEVMNELGVSGTIYIVLRFFLIYILRVEKRDSFQNPQLLCFFYVH